MQSTLDAVSPGETVRNAIVPRLRRAATAVAIAFALAPAARAQAVSADDALGGSGAATESRVPKKAPNRKAASKTGAKVGPASNPNPVRARAEKDRGYRIVVSLEDRHLWVISQQDTLLSAPVAVGSGARLSGLGRTWEFETPRGVRTVIAKRTDPVWTPPDWMYVETAKENGLDVKQLSARRPYTLSDGRKLVIRNGIIGVVDAEAAFTAVRPDEHIIFDETLFIPPLGTKNRRVERELGRFALDTGDGYLLHGTPYESTIGQPVSHGCVRLRDEDIAWLHRYVPVGTRVYLY